MAPVSSILLEISGAYVRELVACSASKVIHVVCTDAAKAHSMHAILSEPRISLMLPAVKACPVAIAILVAAARKSITNRRKKKHNAMYTKQNQRKVASQT